jgi:hypothetical protein
MIQMSRQGIRSVIAIVIVLVAACTPITASTPTPTGDLERARRTLIEFFSLLSHGDYASAANLHAEDENFYNSLRENNPEVEPTDRAALLRAACEYQLRCMEIKSVIHIEQISSRIFRFIVEFADLDGSTFILGPCCGADKTEMPSVSQFEYRVEKVGDLFLVHGSPVYVP